MAYTFEKINEAMGQPADQKSNIFAQQDQAAQQQVQGQAQPAQAGGQVKTSTEGAVEPAKAQAAPAATPQMAGKAVMQIAKKRGANAPVPGFLTQAQQSLAGAQEGLKQEANKYVQQVQQQNYGLGDDVLQKAVQGDKSAYEQTVQRLGQGGPAAVQAFRPETQTSLADIEALRSDAGIKQMLGRQAGGQYTGGESALDLAIMRRNPQFNLIREQLLRGQESLQKQAQDEADARTQEAQNIANERYGQATQQIQQSLGSQAQAVKEAAAKRAAEENALRQQMAQGRDQYSEEQGRATLEQLRKEMAADPRMAEVFGEDLLPAERIQNPGGLGDEYTMRSRLGEYYKGPGEVTAEQAINQEEADRFNRIMGLLGRGNETITPQERAAAQGFDTDRLRQDLISAAQSKRGKLDEGLNKQLNQILSSVDKREANLNKGIQSGAGLREAIDTSVSDVYKTLGKKFGEKDMAKFARSVGVDPNDFAKAQTVGQYGTLTKDEAKQLKQIYQQLGQQVPPGLSAAGSGKTGADFDRKGFEAALTQALQEKKDREAAAKRQAEYGVTIGPKGMASYGKKQPEKKSTIPGRIK